MKVSTSEQTVEVAGALLREKSQVAGKVLDEVKVEPTGRNEVMMLPDVRGATSISPLVARDLLPNAVKHSRRHDPASIKVGSISDERIAFSVRENGVGLIYNTSTSASASFSVCMMRKSSKAQILDSPA